MIAYDYETTNIAVGTPAPLYLTAYSPELHFESRIDSIQHLHQLLTTNFLIPQFHGFKFVAWNGNRFDAYFVAAALIRDDTYIIRPYLTRSKTLRGLRVILAEDINVKNPRGWEFLCGMAMLGLAGLSLEKFLDNFAPDHPKLVGAIDFEKESFDPDNPQHRAYAMQDSVGLWHGMNRAQQIMMQTFDEPLRVTMGGVCIRVFAAHIPRDVTVDPLIPDVHNLIFDYVMRGGFCYCNKRYSGPIWKYDINQAYAAAMRDARLPCGGLIRWKGAPLPEKCAIVLVTATNRANKIPFYHRSFIDGRIKSLFSIKEIPETWITSIEYAQLKAEGWRVQVHDCYSWAKSFDMQEYVDKLEVLRTTCEGGPAGPIGTMVKATGNHSYGKTAEQVEPVEYVLAGECPDDFEPYFADGIDAAPIEHVYFKIDNERRPKAYQKPQLAAFITAHVRMVLRRAALIDPDAWLYADTDCVVFSRDVTSDLDIDAKRYGAWKIEESGAVFDIIAKKVYASADGKKRSAKGLNVKRLTLEDFKRWSDDKPPTQDQIQLQSFLQVMQGAEMFKTQTRRGSRAEPQK